MTRAAVRTIAFAVVFGTALTACSPSVKPSVVVSLRPEDWDSARRELDALRRTEPTTAYAERVQLRLRDRRTGRTLEGRGALAVDPRRAARLVLVGAGGATMLDLWLTRESWRLAVPPLDLVRRGEADDTPIARGLPIAFFRWWFLGRYDGHLLSVARAREALVWTLRNGTATVNLVPGVRSGAFRLSASRRDKGVLDVVEWVGRSPHPHAGDRARYVQLASALTVDVLVEEVSDEPPEPAAFLDPDLPAVRL